jgi:hypothetical protein
MSSFIPVSAPMGGDDASDGKASGRKIALQDATRLDPSDRVMPRRDDYGGETADQDGDHAGLAHQLRTGHGLDAELIF